MADKIHKENRYGLLGRDISYSFSEGYFTQKFKDLKLPDYSYENFDLQNISEIPKLLKENKLKGLNVTIPYKEAVLDYLTEIDSEAKQIGAVNTLQFSTKGIKGYNTDVYGFEASLVPFLKPHHKKALVLGTGGASKAICYVLNKLQIEFKIVSRSPSTNQISYTKLTEGIILEHLIIINCTPVGTYPKVDNKPNIPYHQCSKNHLFYDLIYNPPETAFLAKGREAGAQIVNGRHMLELQAEKSWEIWNR